MEVVSNCWCHGQVLESVLDQVLTSRTIPGGTFAGFSSVRGIHWISWALYKRLGIFMRTISIYVDLIRLRVGFPEPTIARVCAVARLPVGKSRVFAIESWRCSIRREPRTRCGCCWRWVTRGWKGGISGVVNGPGFISLGGRGCFGSRSSLVAG